MRHNRCHRKPQAAIALNAMQRAMSGVALLPRADVERVSAGMRASLQAFSQGQDCLFHWACLADATNVALELSDLGICSDAPSRELLDEAQSVLAAVAERAQQRHSWTLYAAELERLREAVERHAIQLAHCSFSEYETAVATVVRKHQQYAAGNAPKGARIISGALS